jgi:hypothetical protein
MDWGPRALRLLQFHCPGIVLRLSTKRTGIMFPSTVNRVRIHTATHINQRIRTSMEARVRRIAAAGLEAIDRRLNELDREWDIERTLEANAASLTITGALLALVVDRRFAAVPLTVGAFLLQHATEGWCPPVPIFRRYGFRTQAEIEQERYALKALRGDFHQVRPDRPAGAVDRTLGAVNE